MFLCFLTREITFWLKMNIHFNKPTEENTEQEKRRVLQVLINGSVGEGASLLLCQ